MINLQELRLEDLLPGSIKDDKTISSLASAIDTQLQQVTKSIEETMILPKIDTLHEMLVDLLAWQFHVDFYEPLGLDLDIKRELVKNSIIFHKNKGTKSVIENIIKILYTENVELTEWYEYGGDPYFFKVIAKGMELTQENVVDMLFAIYELKNTRSWLENITFHDNVYGKLYFGGIRESESSQEFIKHKHLRDKSFLSKLYVGGHKESQVNKEFIKHKKLKDKDFLSKLHIGSHKQSEVSKLRIDPKTMQDMSFKSINYTATAIADISRMFIETLPLRG